MDLFAYIFIMQSNQTGSRAPFPSDFTSPFWTQWINKLTFCPVLLVVATLKENGNSLLNNSTAYVLDTVLYTSPEDYSHHVTPMSLIFTFVFLQSVPLLPPIRCASLQSPNGPRPARPLQRPKARRLSVNVVVLWYQMKYISTGWLLRKPQSKPSRLPIDVKQQCNSTVFCIDICLFLN